MPINLSGLHEARLRVQTFMREMVLSTPENVSIISRSLAVAAIDHFGLNDVPLEALFGTYDGFMKMAQETLRSAFPNPDDEDDPKQFSLPEVQILQERYAIGRREDSRYIHRDMLSMEQAQSVAALLRKAGDHKYRHADAIVAYVARRSAA
jgi:hypothetical protein